MTAAPAARSESLSSLAGIRHGYFGRKGGVSAGIYDSLNCGPGSSDAPEAVHENRARVARTLGAQHLLSLYQVHGVEVITVREPWENGASRPRCDAMVTDRPGLALGGPPGSRNTHALARRDRKTGNRRADLDHPRVGMHE